MAKGGDIPTFKCVLIGDSGTGKTAHVLRHLNGEYITQHEPNNDVDIIRLEFYSNRGPIVFKVWDTPGQKASFQDTCYYKADCAIIMFDVSSPVTYHNVPIWYKELTRMCSRIPIALCGNKTDNGNHRQTPRYFHRQNNMQCYNMSTRCSSNICKPYLWFTRTLLGDPCIEFIPQLAPIPPEVRVNSYMLFEVERKLQEAQDAPLPKPAVDL